MTRWIATVRGLCGGPLAVAALTALPALAAWAAFGPLVVADSHGYLDYTAMLRAGAVPSGAALLREGPVPVTLFRMGGYPAVLAVVQWLAGRDWAGALVGVQIAAQAAVAVGSYRAAQVLGLRRGVALLVAVLPAIGLAAVLEVCVLSDTLCGALMCGAALVLVIRPRLSSAVLAGACLALATTMREATVFVALGYLPLAAGIPGAWRRRAAAAALVLLLPCCVAGAQVAWNVARQAGPVLTTSRQTVMVQAVLPLVAAGYPVFAGDDLFDRTARATVGSGELWEIDRLHRTLFAAGMTAPAMAVAASGRYWAAWRRFPWAMARAMLDEVRISYFTMPLQPLETVGNLAIFAGDARPAFTRVPQQWALLRHGDVLAGLVIVLAFVTQLFGIVITLAGLAGPWLLPGAWRLRALWCVCAGLVGVYLPVHIEPRYIAPAMPLVCLLATVTVARAAAWRAPRMAIATLPPTVRVASARPR